MVIYTHDNFLIESGLLLAKSWMLLNVHDLSIITISWHLISVCNLERKKPSRKSDVEELRGLMLQQDR